MKILLNGEEREVNAARLSEVLVELGFAGATIATAVNGDFVPAAERTNTELAEGDRLEVVAPQQGG
ncbi:MAG TPA: sulfur carrier protein ThiS [Paracoccaceae bacterium]|nr:sulfur carrier protein ThiS [Paracoccaceae bacterium]